MINICCVVAMLLMSVNYKDTPLIRCYLIIMKISDPLESLARV
jgi:hypothetical protein